MAKFVVDLGDYKLDPDQHHKMASAIHTAVLGQLAQHPIASGAAPMAAITTIDGMLHRNVGTDLNAAHAELKKAVS